VRFRLNFLLRVIVFLIAAAIAGGYENRHGGGNGQQIKKWLDEHNFRSWFVYKKNPLN
jgi:hypothetical protein